MADQGYNNAEIGRTIGISRERVRQIKAFKAKSILPPVISNEICKRIRENDNIDELHPVEDILAMVNVPDRLKNTIDEHYAKSRISKSSLRHLMDTVLADTDAPEAPVTGFPLYQYRWVRNSHYIELVAWMSRTDLGKTYKAEWKQRLKKLRQWQSDKVKSELVRSMAKEFVEAIKTLEKKNDQ
jgi:hypothetical protein